MTNPCETLSDWQLAADAESQMLSPTQLAAANGILESELIPMGRAIAKVDAAAVMRRLPDKPRGKFINITAITPTPLGEGKTTAAIGLIQGLGHIGKIAGGAIRQPSGGPTWNIKGSAAGGGRAQCIPLTPFSIRLTGDIDAVTNAHNLAMVALTARMQHERNYDDARLQTLGLQRLDIDPQRVELRWAIDFCAQALRNIIIGQGGKLDGVEMPSGFQISVSSEVMAILAMANDLADLRERIGRMVVAHSRHGTPITTADLQVDGAMTAWLIEAINPNLLQTMEGQPMLVHAGPFANIALGQSSIIADRVGLRLWDYHITESGFGADIGYEKFWNLKCRLAGLRPDAVVIVATIRALKMHGGGPAVKPGAPLPPVYTQPAPELVEAGCANLAAHIEIVRKSGITPVVCINHFPSDTPDETRLVIKLAEQAGAQAVVSRHWESGGAGAAEFAEVVAAAADQPSQFRFLYQMEQPLKEKIAAIAGEVYGADGVDYTPIADAKLAELQADPITGKWGICMAKTHLSLSHDPQAKGRPRGWRLPVRDVLAYHGAGLIVPVTGEISLMPGTASRPAFMRVDVNTATGQVQGLF
ncbi:MAG: formate--tetrahydrofolate ligase [Kiritimatiellia bacterium]|jgi:formate--tetrahydrofolate ligase